MIQPVPLERARYQRHKLVAPSEPDRIDTTVIEKRLLGEEVKTMKTLIVHIEYDDDPEGEDVQEEVSGALEDLRDRVLCEIGWRFFQSLEAATVWEVGSE